jgi:hypothetical protein
MWMRFISQVSKIFPPQLMLNGLRNGVHARQSSYAIAAENTRRNYSASAHAKVIQKQLSFRNFIKGIRMVQTNNRDNYMKYILKECAGLSMAHIYICSCM